MIAVRLVGSAATLGSMTMTVRRLLTAEVFSIGTELTVGETRDTNAGELARSLTTDGVRVTRMTVLPDHLATVREAFRLALDRVDLVISTGGLGPTPDDLTREAVAEACGETPSVDPDLERWLRELWSRRDMPFPEMNLKQAWRIPSSISLPNPNGTAPGWFVSRPDGRVVVTLPGPPREMRPMWADHVIPRLRSKGYGADIVSRTYRLAGIGESQVAELLGERLLRSIDPVVATYARAEAVDVRISALGRDGRSAEAAVEAVADDVLRSVGRYVWATGETTWSEAIGARLGARGWSLAVVESGTGGSVATVLGDVPWLRLAERIGDDDSRPAATDDLATAADLTRDRAGVDVVLAVRARARTHDTAVSTAIVTPVGRHELTRVVFLTGPMGRMRAGLSAASALFDALRDAS
jgi:competence/damage-inducible protein CinA-like protein